MQNNNPLTEIPEHTRCINCGECCGPIAMSRDDYIKIRDYLEAHLALKQAILEKAFSFPACIFRDTQKCRCLIYPVRPLICRLYGISKHSHCKNGNTHHLPVKININPNKLWIPNVLFGNPQHIMRYIDAFTLWHLLSYDSEVYVSISPPV